jgi:nitrite reductase/ring-hydroxylating ferredoxin subunit
LQVTCVGSHRRSMATSEASEWLYAGLASSFPNIEPDEKAKHTGKTKLGTTNSVNEQSPPCRILKTSTGADGRVSACELTADEAQETIGFEPQVLVFRYRGKIVAVDHCCPHRNYPLSRGSIYDIEDFGIVLSAGITCPGHGWAFDLYTGLSDRGTYKLGVWETELRTNKAGEDEVWVRRKDG